MLSIQFSNSEKETTEFNRDAYFKFSKNLKANSILKISLQIVMKAH